MAYNPNIPQPTDDLSTSQGQLLANFQAIQTLIDVNHVDFANGTQQGKHFFVEFPAQSVIPVTAGGEVGLYCQTSTLSGNPELVFSHQSGTGIYEFTSSGQATNGWGRLPSGILFKWGNTSVVGGGSQTITFPVSSSTPVFTGAFIAFLTPTTNTVFFQTGLTVTTLTVNASAAGSFNYLVIGV